MIQCKKCGAWNEDDNCLECLGEYMKDNLTESDIDNIVKALLGPNAWQIIIEDNERHRNEVDRSI
jgi:hypothetical protein